MFHVRRNDQYKTDLILIKQTFDDVYIVLMLAIVIKLAFFDCLNN